MAKSRPLIWIEYGVARALLFLLRLVPRQAAVGFGSFFGRVLYYLSRHSRQTVYQNLAIAFGPADNKYERKQLARAIFSNLGKTFFEFLQFPRLTSQQILDKVQFHNLDVVKRALAQGRGLIAVTCHVGNWELFAAGYAVTGGLLYAVVRLLDNPLLDRYVERFREDKGVNIIARKYAVPGSLRALKKNASVAFLMDQNAAVNGVFVPFFGKLAATVQGPAVLALRTGAPVLFVYSLRNPDGGHTLYFQEPFPFIEGRDRAETIRLNTAQYTAAIEKVVRKHPDQWLWLHPRWRTRPEDESAK